MSTNLRGEKDDIYLLKLISTPMFGLRKNLSFQDTWLCNKNVPKNDNGVPTRNFVCDKMFHAKPNMVAQLTTDEPEVIHRKVVGVLNMFR